MPETINKLQPDRDLQCYFLRPSAIAAMSGASPTGFTVSGTWRQQFDWSVIEWNRDNVFEHPMFRYLPDGDLSGLALSYEETRTNCIAIDSDLFPTVDWPTLRVWATPAGGVEDIYFVPLFSHATPIEGSYTAAFADFTLTGSVTGGDTVGIEFLGQHHTYTQFGGDTLDIAIQRIMESVNAFSPVMRATQSGTTLRLHYAGTIGGTKPLVADAVTGSNGNRIGAYTYTSSGATASWNIASATLANGTSPTKWRIDLDFSALTDNQTPARTVPTNNVRKLRWTYSADLQAADYVRSEFAVAITNWAVTGTNRIYSVASPSSQRFEDNDSEMDITGTWLTSRGNFSGGTIHFTQAAGAAAQLTYRASEPHTLYLGTRLVPNGAPIHVEVDGTLALSESLALNGEDILVRRPVGQFAAGQHSVTVSYQGPTGKDLYFDFLEVVVPTTNLPTVESDSKVTLATDWDTDHSIALPPERTAWMVKSLGFHGRANHYVGALWFYELLSAGNVYASATVTFSGTPTPSQTVEINIQRTGAPPGTTITHLIHIGDDASTIALAYAQDLNRGYTAVRATVSANVLTIWSRSLGADGNLISITASASGSGFTATPAGGAVVDGRTPLAGGHDGDWRTDLVVDPPLNRAVRDWSRAYFAAMSAYSIDVAAAFSMELQHVDPSPAAGLAQRGPAGDEILLPTPAIQTNFSPASRDFWKRVYAGMATLQSDAGQTPYLQFGEVQWWYFPSDGLGHAFSGMPFYDDWTTSTFAAAFGRPLATFTNNFADPGAHADDVAFLAQAIADFTDTVIAWVKASEALARFEVLYPTDVNQTAFNQAINYPLSSWNPANLTCLKTESFGFTLNRDLVAGATTVAFGVSQGFTPSTRSHLIGIGDYTTAWSKETRMAIGAGFESAVLFALDQFCLIGYDAPLSAGLRRSLFMG